MQKHQDARGIASRRDRPFVRHAVEIDLIKTYVVGDGPDGIDLIQAFAPLLPPHGPRLRLELSNARIALISLQFITNPFPSKAIRTCLPMMKIL
jgi:hypothetical protein